MFLALYIELYWIYAAWQSKLHREKPRQWREGSGKVAAP
jgi:hypothetical protein